MKIELLEHYFFCTIFPFSCHLLFNADAYILAYTACQCFIWLNFDPATAQQANYEMQNVNRKKGSRYAHASIVWFGSRLKYKYPLIDMIFTFSSLPSSMCLFFAAFVCKEPSAGLLTYISAISYSVILISFFFCVIRFLHNSSGNVGFINSRHFPIMFFFFSFLRYHGFTCRRCACTYQYYSR